MAVVSYVDKPPTPEVEQLYARLERASGGLGVLNVFKVMAHTPDLMRAWWDMMAAAFSRLALSPRLRELAILRVFVNTGGAYGFAHHVRIARGIDITDGEIAALSAHDDDRFPAVERLALRYTDAVADLSDDAPALARELSRHLSERELVELTFCIANWSLMARLLQPLEVDLDESIRAYLPAGWPAR